MASLLARILTGIFTRKRATVTGATVLRKRLVDEGQLAEIRLSPCSIEGGCRAACCTKGVSMVRSEAERITEFVAAHPGHFAHLKRVGRAIVPLDTLGKPGLSQTEVVTPRGIGRKGLYRAALEGQRVTPQDNAGSMCVFALPDARCSLQVAAVSLGLHKWEFKPMSCWLFPLASVVVEDKDGCRYYRLDHAGAVNEKYGEYRCSRLDPAGRPAAELLSEEIEYYRTEFIGAQSAGADSAGGRYAKVY